jgi:hypothetical protein
VQHAIASNMSEDTIGYPKSLLNGPSLGHGLKPGERVPPVAGQKPVGLGDTPRFALFAASSPDVIELVKKFDGLLDPDIRSPLVQDGIWLVRPDGYVACSAKEASTISDYLGRILSGKA